MTKGKIITLYSLKHQITIIFIRSTKLHRIVTSISITIVTGSGVTSTIQKATLPLISDDECRRFWGRSIRHGTQICAGGRAGNMQSACQVIEYKE